MYVDDNKDDSSDDVQEIERTPVRPTGRQGAAPLALTTTPNGHASRLPKNAAAAASPAPDDDVSILPTPATSAVGSLSLQPTPMTAGKRRLPGVFERTGASPARGRARFGNQKA